MQLRFALFNLWLFALIAQTAWAQDSPDSALSRFHTLFDNNQMNQLYQDFAGQFVRSLTTKDAFVAQLSIMRSQLGGSAVNRSVIQQQTGIDPSSRSALVSFRYIAQFPTAKVYEDLTLINEQQSGWKLYGIYFNPIPTQ